MTAVLTLIASHVAEWLSLLETEVINPSSYVAIWSIFI